MTTPDPFDSLTLTGLEVCGALATSAKYAGQPILVGDLLTRVQFPQVPPVVGAPVVELIVTTAGVDIVTTRWGVGRVVDTDWKLKAQFVPFTLIDGVPCMGGSFEDAWRDEVDNALAGALHRLHAFGAGVDR